jgi:hypothetical protein
MNGHKVWAMLVYCVRWEEIRHDPAEGGGGVTTNTTGGSQTATRNRRQNYCNKRWITELAGRGRLRGGIQLGMLLSQHISDFISGRGKNNHNQVQISAWNSTHNHWYCCVHVVITTGLWQDLRRCPHLRTHLSVVIGRSVTTNQAANRRSIGRSTDVRTRKFITVFTKARHRPYPGPDESTPHPTPPRSQPISLRYILISSSHLRLRAVSFPTAFPPEPCTFFSPVRATSPVYLILYFLCLIILGNEYKVIKPRHLLKLHSNLFKMPRNYHHKYIHILMHNLL